tara:strand:- start:821 stop:1123 length:303 start_codon:yes stop_codon:yes gene_type:complete
VQKFIKAKIASVVYKNYNYNKVNYTGITKLLYYFNHKLMDFGINQEFNAHILDIGGGAEPHLKYMDPKNIKSYTVLDAPKFKLSAHKLINYIKDILFKLP